MTKATFITVKSTLICAIKNGKLTTWTSVTMDKFNKNLTNSKSHDSWKFVPNQQNISLNKNHCLHGQILCCVFTIILQWKTYRLCICDSNQFTNRTDYHISNRRLTNHVKLEEWIYFHLVWLWQQCNPLRTNKIP